MFKELFPSDMLKISFETSLEWLPFYFSKTEAIRQLNKDIVTLKDEDAFFGWYEKGKLAILIYVTFNDKKMMVKNVLLMDNRLSSINVFRGLMTIAKRYRMEQIILNLYQQATSNQMELEAHGYSYVEEVGYVGKLSYDTGLVLGGGGAKGSYQIGVWRALEELDIKFNMISGTSVGALNGGLIIQGELASAEKMWETITTEKVLLIPESNQKENYSVNKLVDSLQRLTLTAIQKNGISAAPLLKIIHDLMIPERIISSDYSFFIVTTAIPSMEEKVVSLTEMTVETFPLWLLASASFFPAMQASLVEGNYYVDGGYRNNVPKDILIQQGVSELIVVDVEGPGITKPVKTPPNIVETLLKSSWSLGNVLLFDGNRSSWNMRLGSLETQKAFGKYKGMSYTFTKEDYKRKSLKLSREFFQFLNQNDIFLGWFHKKEPLKIWDWLLKNNVTPEFVSILLMESLGKKLEVDPTHVYEIEELGQILVGKIGKEELVDNPHKSEKMMRSITELATTYFKQKAPITDYQLMIYYYRYFKKQETKIEEGLSLLMDVSWFTALEALFLLFLEKRN